MQANIFLATFTTCWARLKLYSVLEKLGQSVLYYDTDSIIHVSTPTGYAPELGDYLGDLTSELLCKDVACQMKSDCTGHHIVEFVSAGPKNYAYRTNNNFECCKVRGFTLNFTNSQLINFDVVKDIVTQPHEGSTQSVTTVNKAKIVRDKYTRAVYNREEKKVYKKVYTKRVIQADFNTYPYGY